MSAADATGGAPVTGLLLVHFVEDPRGHGERVFFSLADGLDPLRWTRLHGGAPVLESRIGTTGARDPHVVRDGDGFALVATDLRVFGRGPQRWDAWRRTGSRSLLVWRSPDLVAWSGPELLEAAPPEAGMAWAPEVGWDPATGEHRLSWSSALFAEDDPAHRGPARSRIMAARSRDLRGVHDLRVVLDRGTDVIDARTYDVGGRRTRFAKEEPGPGSLGVFQEVEEADGWRLVASGIGRDRHERVEGPMLVRDRVRGSWVLLLDQYDTPPQGFVAHRADDPFAGWWTPVPDEELVMPPGTKHGGVLELLGDEPERLRRAFG